MSEPTESEPDAARHSNLRVRSIRPGFQGVTISGTEYVLHINELRILRNHLNRAIERAIMEVIHAQQ